MSLNIEIIWAFFIAAMVIVVVGLGLLASMIIGQRRFLQAERRRIREHRRAELRFRDLFNSVSDIIYAHSNDGDIRLVNNAVRIHLGLNPDDLIGKNLLDLLPGNASEEYGSYLRRIEERGSDHGIIRLRTGNGRWVFFEYESSRADAREGEGGIRGICRNVTKRIEADRILKKSERMFRRFVSSSQVPALVERAGVVLYANAAAASLFGVEAPSRLIGENLITAFEYSNDDGQYDQLKYLLTHHERMPIVDTRLRRPSGDIRDVAISTVPLVFEGEIAAHVVFDDITERKRTAQALAEEKERLAVTLRSIHDGVIAADLDGGIVLMSRSAEEMTGIGVENAMGQKIEDICIMRDLEHDTAITDYVGRIIRRKGFFGDNEEGFLISRDGRKRLVAANGVPIVNRLGEEIGVILAFHDITERKRFENELVRSAKMESIALLAGGLAHDFNNILASIIGSITVAKEFIGTHKDASEILDEAKQGVLRARDLTRQLITISSGGSTVRQTADIAEVIRESVNLTLRGSNAKAFLELPEDLMSVRADVTQLSQVFTNLLINAVQAMPMGGEIRIRGSNVHSGTSVHTTLMNEPFICIELTDQGIGIPDEHIEHIFEPFYTTKDKGTGLGLASVYSVINAHGGRIEVISHPGEGTTFMVYLPATEEKPSTGSGLSAPVLISGDLRALVIDDDRSVLRSLSRMLSFVGLTVSACDSAVGGISRFIHACECGNPFDIVFLDLKIPGGPGGLEIIGRLLEADPRARVVAISAHLQTIEDQDLEELGFWAHLAKPFTLEELKTIIAEVRIGERTGSIG